MSWKIYKRDRLAVVGLTILFFFLFIAILGPYLTPYPPLMTNVGGRLEPPSIEHLMGTDETGRDIFSWVIGGARISIAVGLLATLSATVIGILIGSVSGYLGGVVDLVLMRLTEAFMVIPKFVLALVMVAIIGNSIWNIIFVIAILSWPTMARLIRGDFLALKEEEFVLAAKAIGEKKLFIIFSEILPNAVAPVIVAATLQVGSAILIESSLSFLGAGDPNVPSWGMIIRHAQRFLRQGWWLAVFPGIAILLAVLSVNLVGDGLNDLVNPKTRLTKR
ncbi:MAG: ABC transporter permease [Promethearchaeota archaeon]